MTDQRQTLSVRARFFHKLTDVYGSAPLQALANRRGTRCYRGASMTALIEET